MNKRHTLRVYRLRLAQRFRWYSSFKFFDLLFQKEYLRHKVIVLKICIFVLRVYHGYPLPQCWPEDEE